VTNQLDRKKNKSISLQSAELAEAVPQVLSNRIAQIASPGLQPSMEDIVELNRMWSEKMLATVASWSEINSECLCYQEKVMEATAKSSSNPWMMPQAFLVSSMMFAPSAVMGILGRGLEPVHKVAMANAERLAGEAKS